MAKKPKLDVNRKEVRAEIQRTGGRQIDVDRPSTPTGKKAERIAAKLQGVSSELTRNNRSHDQKKTNESGKKTRKHSRAA